MMIFDVGKYILIKLEIFIEKEESKQNE